MVTATQPKKSEGQKKTRSPRRALKSFPNQDHVRAGAKNPDSYWSFVTTSGQTIRLQKLRLTSLEDPNLLRSTVKEVDLKGEDENGKGYTCHLDFEQKNGWIR